ncbi:hypothetical protein LEN26_008634 [Aphanomyces euteiches]|nr:hypothetical protein AeMF1_017315 [Aphanomyces euteiches]KAH9130350.1 hypothetical protein LEN26_008634 [Aphanomyces euteiches]
MFSIFKSKTHKPTHCWTCAKKFRIFTCHANECADCGRSICRDCAVSMRILNKKIKLCFECCGTLTSRRSRPTMTTTPSETNNTLVLSPPQAASHDSRGPCESILFSTVGSDLEEERELMQQVDACLSFLDITQDETTASTTTITVAVVAFESVTTYQRTTVEGHDKPSCNLANEATPPEEGHVVDIRSSTEARIDPNANCSPNFDMHDLPSSYSSADVSVKANNADTALGSLVETSNQPKAKCSLNDVNTIESADKSPHRPESTKNNSTAASSKLHRSQRRDIGRHYESYKMETFSWPRSHSEFKTGFRYARYLA